jgi:hypothetical protein
MPEEKQETSKPLRRVRVVNDGQPGYATRITDADTGQPLDSIYHVKVVDIDVRDVPKIFLWSHQPVIDIVGDAETTNVCPLCKASTNVKSTEDNKHKLKIDIDDSEVVYAIDRLRELRWQHDEFLRQSIGPAEAITAFMAWLTTRKEVSGPFYAGLEKASDEAAKLVEQFCRAQGWSIKNEKYAELIKEAWEDGFVAIIEE